MPKAEWGVDPGFFGPRHAHREARLMRALASAPVAAPHLECAAGVGSLAVTLARSGRTVVAADSSLRSLAVVARTLRSQGGEARVLPVVADITRLPFRDATFASASSAETLEHVGDDRGAVAELARVLRPGGLLAGTVPAFPEQWSPWDEWAGHLRRYRPTEMAELLRSGGLAATVHVWGWPSVRLYDAVFLGRVNRRRLETTGTVEEDAGLRRVAALGRRRWLVAAVRAVFAIDRVFDGLPWGVGLLFCGRKPDAPSS